MDDVIQKVQRHEDLIKAHAVRKATFIRSMCNNAVNMVIENIIECLLMSSLPGKTLRTLVDIARLAE